MRRDARRKNDGVGEYILDLASVLGMILGFAAVIFGILSSGENILDGVGMLSNFYDFPSIVITLGGSLTGVMASNKLASVPKGFKSIRLAMREQTYDPASMISNIIQLSNVARKEGLLALEEAAAEIEDDFLKKGIMLVVDGTDPELVRAILETDLSSTEDRHKSVIGFWEKWAELGPAWGMIGTLIGLINMLKKLDDPSSIGPQMAVALVTTFYGSIIANWLCNPVASKLKLNHESEMVIKQIIVEGLLSIQAGENPHVIEEKLKTFIAPQEREVFGATVAGGEE